MKTAALAITGALLLAGCGDHRIENPYRRQGQQDPRGTPSDRTGGARNVPDGVGGGPDKPSPADQPPNKKTDSQKQPTSPSPK